MDTDQFQNILTRIQTDIASNAKHFVPAAGKLNLESISSAAVVLVGFWAASILVRKIASGFYRARKIDEALSGFLQRVTKFLFLSFGIVTALGTLGVDVSAIVAGMGLTGLALGIALKDIVSNAVSGVMLLLFRPFRHRDRIRVADFEGDVTDIDLRYTHLRVEGRTIYVPNSLLFANAVIVQRYANAEGKTEKRIETAKNVPHAHNRADDFTPNTFAEERFAESLPIPLPPARRKSALLSLAATEETADAA